MRHRLLGGILLAAALALAFRGTAPSAAQVNGGGAVTIAGQTEPAERVEVPAVLRGQLVRVSVKEGQPIKKGDEIAQLDDALQKQTVELAKVEADSTIDIRYQEAMVAHAQNELDRYMAMSERARNVTEQKSRELAVKEAQLKLELAKEIIGKKKIDLAREQITLEKMTIRSPLEGSVLRVNHQSGEMVDVDKPMAIVVQTSRLHARFYPPKQLFGKIKVGDKVTVELRTEPATTREATVIAVDPTLDVASQLFQVKMEFANADQSIPAGTTASWVWNEK